jgi:hypothetical protein
MGKVDPQEQRRLVVKLLREAADFVEAQDSKPERIGPVIWEAMLAIERQAERRHRPPAA